MTVMTQGKMASRCSTEVRARAVRIGAATPKFGCIPQTLRLWVRKAEKDSGMRDGVTSDEPDRIKVLEREVR